MEIVNGHSLTQLNLDVRKRQKHVDGFKDWCFPIKDTFHSIAKCKVIHDFNPCCITLIPAVRSSSHAACHST